VFKIFLILYLSLFSCFGCTLQKTAPTNKNTSSMDLDNLCPDGSGCCKASLEGIKREFTKQKIPIIALLPLYQLDRSIGCPEGTTGTYTVSCTTPTTIEESPRHEGGISKMSRKHHRDWSQMRSGLPLVCSFLKIKIK